jgi:hypothetical protein
MISIQALHFFTQREFQVLQKEMQELVEIVQNFRRLPVHQGHVWF